MVGRGRTPVYEIDLWNLYAKRLYWLDKINQQHMFMNLLLFSDYNLKNVQIKIQIYWKLDL